MTSVAEPKTLEEYQSQVKELEAKKNTKAILALIEDRQDAHSDCAELDAFFKGEHAFYSKNYEKALVYYMQARQVEEFAFYCYRATAFVSYARKDLEKAASFIDKALSMKPEDPLTLKLKEEMRVQKEENGEAPPIHPQEIDVEPPEKADLLPSSQQPLNEPSSDFISSKLGVDVEAEQELERKIHAYQTRTQAAVKRYLDNSPKIAASQEDALWILSGWDQPKPEDVIPEMPSKSGGFFLRWNGHGIAVNPGKSFLDRFHEEGLHLHMIDSVIVTESNNQAHADIQKIYNLNYELNKTAAELHIIRYFLNHNAHQRLAHALKPNFKHERNTVHSLELFLDSPDIEKEQMTEEITLSYFSTESRSSLSSSDKACALGIKLELAKGAEVKKIGFVSGTGWSPIIGSRFGAVDLMLSSFGATEPNDYGKLNYTPSELGYYGTYTLLEEVKPALHLIAAFDGKQGDIRLEAIKKLRKEYAVNHPSSPNTPIVLPADRGMKVELNQLKIQSSITCEMLAPHQVQICKTKDLFGALRYISQDNLL